MEEQRSTCIICPRGCEVLCRIGGDEMVEVSGNACPRGRAYAVQECLDPVRNIASSVGVEGGVLPLVSVRLTRPIPKGRIFDVMAEIKKARVKAPVALGQTIVPDVLGLGSDIIATKNVAEQKG